jgi:hypothetical protein
VRRGTAGRAKDSCICDGRTRRSQSNYLIQPELLHISVILFVRLIFNRVMQELGECCPIAAVFEHDNDPLWDFADFHASDSQARSSDTCVPT